MTPVDDAKLLAAGLSEAEVGERRAAGLSNTLPNDTGRSFARILQANLFTLFNAIAGGSFLLLLTLGYWQDALFGFFLIANVLIGVAQEFRAKLTLSRLAVLNAPRARVLRHGEVSEIAVAEVVLDDLLVLTAGDQVTADAVVLESAGLDIDESLLTGEADPVEAQVGRELLSGSSVVGGHGSARVIRVGAESYASRITAEAKQFSLVNSELRSSLARIIQWISWALLPVGIIVVNGQMQAQGGWEVAIESGAWRQAVVASVASLISMVPQGLVFMTSVALAVGAVKLSRHGVLVQELAAVEGLARIDILCLDKTGTLTEGRLELDAVEPANEQAGWELALGWFSFDRNANITARALAERFTGDDSLEASTAVSFSSQRKWSSVSFTDGRAAGAWVLGGGDIVLAKDDPALARTAELASSGKRTLVLAHAATPMSATDAEAERLPQGLTLVAILTFREKVRPDARETLGYFRDQGVDLCVISGDDPRTVAAVAREAGVHNDGDGYDARTLPQDRDELDAVMARERVFGRVTPEQKKEMVLSLQRIGHVVAMTGDGVNDALALKYADMGIAMGSGSAATRAVSRIILLDGQFSRLPRVVAEGRQVIANVERLAKLFLTKTVYAILWAVTFGALLWPFPFLPRQLSIVDGLTIGIPALLLALLPNSRRYVPGFLRRAARFCIPAGLTIGTVIISVVSYTFLSGYEASEVQSVAFVTLTLTALWVVVILSRPFDRWKALVVFAMYAGLVLIFAIPIATDFLRIEFPPLELLWIALTASAAGCLVLELLHRAQHNGHREAEAEVTRAARITRRAR
jgi:cation-transporting ATPase E